MGDSIKKSEQQQSEQQQCMELIHDLKNVKLTVSSEGKEEYQSITPNRTAQMKDINEQLEEISDLDKKILKNLNKMPNKK